MRGVVDMQFTQLAAQGSWAEEAACRGSTMDFTSDHPVIINKAKAFCRTSCPVREQCLQHALDHREPYGVWGGLDSHDRLGIRPGMYDRGGKRPNNCVVCEEPLEDAAPNSRLCSDACRLARKRIREASYVSKGEARLCPECRRPVQQRYDNIPRHQDSAGNICPTTGRPYSITLPPSDEVAS